METANFKKTGRLVDLSEQQLINCDTSDFGCNGGWFPNAYTYAKTKGLSSETTNPYKAAVGTCTTTSGTVVKVANYTQIKPRDTTSIKNALSQGYSVAAALEAGTYSFMYYTGGILSDAFDCSGDSIDHAIVIIGYGTANGIDYWIVRNTWGTSWGESGYVRIKRNINYCNLETYPFFPVIA
uniref:Peptidase C1A papain C-terminal domain-containing protein n=1 Tax=Panagrolaimus sp. JU765 TaxID=591449 RepID=A0AC34Q3U1_9BILA